MSEPTARKYREAGKLPSELKGKHTWRTRPDAFAEVWVEAQALLERDSGLQAKTVFKELQRRHPGRFTEGQLRTLQRRFRQWKALRGPEREVFYPSPSSGGAMPIGFHGHEVARGDDWRRCISASVLPLCADLLELGGYRDCVFRDLRGAEWGFAGGGCGG